MVAVIPAGFPVVLEPLAGGHPPVGGQEFGQFEAVFLAAVFAVAQAPPARPFDPGARRFVLPQAPGSAYRAPGPCPKADRSSRRRVGTAAGGPNAPPSRPAGACPAGRVPASPRVPAWDHPGGRPTESAAPATAPAFPGGAAPAFLRVQHRRPALLATATALGPGRAGPPLQPDCLRPIPVPGQSSHGAQVIALPISQQFGKAGSGQRWRRVRRRFAFHQTSLPGSPLTATVPPRNSVKNQKKWRWGSLKRTRLPVRTGWCSCVQRLRASSNMQRRAAHACASSTRQRRFNALTEFRAMPVTNSQGWHRDAKRRNARQSARFQNP